MAYNEAKKASNKKSDEKYSQILLKPYKEDAAQIREAAANEGMSVQGYILQAVRKQMSEATESAGVVKNSESEPLTEEAPSCSISPELNKAITKCIQDAVENFPEEEYDKLRYALDKLIYDTFSSESRKPKKVVPDKKDEPEEKKPKRSFVCKSLIPEPPEP